MKILCRRGFTLVELLVVIAMISLLIGLMLPGMQGAREVGRRSQCQTQLAKLGLALQSYESTNGTLPSGTTDSQGPIHNVAKGNHIAWTVQLLPYLDERSAFQQTDQSAGAYDPKNAQVRNLHVAAFICPSTRSLNTAEFSPSSYAGCCNDIESPIDEKNNGVFFLNSHISARDITDGLQHTIYLGEKNLSDGDLGWMSGTRATLRNAGQGINRPTDVPPKSDLIVGGFGSGHVAGCYFLFGDGAIHFVHDEIELPLLQHLANRADGTLITSGPTRGE